MNIDENVLRPVYSSFEKILEYWLSQKTKKYKFKIQFEGFENYLDKQDRFDRVSKLANMGIVLEQKFASAIGMSPFDFREMLAETKANGFVDGLTPILMANQMSANAGAGAPKKAESDLGEGGADNRASGASEEKNQE